MKVKEESEKVGLKLNIQKTQLMASGPITLWEIWEIMGMVTVLIFLGSKITADGNCSHEIKRRLLLGTKALTPWKKSSDKPRQCIKEQRHYFANKGLYSQSDCFSSSHVWMT